jgi:HK97 family phage portal protein
MTSPFIVYDQNHSYKSGQVTLYSEEGWSIAGKEKKTRNLSELYDAVGWLYRCVDLRSASLGNLPWVLEKEGDAVWRKDDEVPDDLKWLENLPELLPLSEASMVLTSETYWFIQRTGGGISEIRWLSPTTMKPHWSATEGLVGYWRDIGNGQPKRFLSLEDVVYNYKADPMHETDPDTSPAQAALSSAGVLFSIDTFTAGFFDRGAIKATLLTVPPNTKEPEREKLERWWKRFFAGVSRAWASNVVSTGVTPVQVGEGMESLSNNSLTIERREDIATTIGVPHSLVASNAANYATAEIDQRNLYTFTILPSAFKLAQAINKQLLSPLGYNFRFLPQELSIFQEDETKRSTAVLNLVNAGMPLSVALETLGYDLSDENWNRLDGDLENLDMGLVSSSGETPSFLDREEEGKRADLDKWRRKAKKNHKRNGNFAVTFDSEYLDEYETELISSALQVARTAEEVEAVFSDGSFQLGLERYP